MSDTVEFCITLVASVVHSISMSVDRLSEGMMIADEMFGTSAATITHDADESRAGENTLCK